MISVSTGLSIPHPKTEVREGWRGLIAFLFPQDSGQWLTILRVGLGLEVVLYAISLYPDWQRMFGSASSGFLNREFSEAILSIQNPLVPKLGWLLAITGRIGFSEQGSLIAIWVLLFVSGLFLIAGLFSRIAAVAAWLIHLCSAKTGGYFSYGMDNFITIGLFYLMLAPLPDRFALDHKLWRARQRDPEIVGFFRRVLQLHLCLIYFFGGLTKSLGAGWWNGDSMWRALIRPPFDVIPSDVLIHLKPVLVIAGIVVCVLETGFPIFIWPKQTRLFWLVGIIGMHVGIALTMGLYLFSLIMIVLDVAAFGPGVRVRPWRTRAMAATISPG